jgi:hypothetical protein
MQLVFDNCSIDPFVDSIPNFFPEQTIVIQPGVRLEGKNTPPKNDEKIKLLKNRPIAEEGSINPGYESSFGLKFPIQFQDVTYLKKYHDVQNRYKKLGENDSNLIAYCACQSDCILISKDKGVCKGAKKEGVRFVQHFEGESLNELVLKIKTELER